MSNYTVKIWGCRGSICQTRDDMRVYGLNTSCISLETPEEIIIVDGGSGIALFDEYYYESLCNKKIKIILTHYHYDHILGLPFTKFLYDKNVDVEIYGATYNGESCVEIFSKIYCSPFFPLELEDLTNVSFINIDRSICDKFSKVKIDYIDLNHKGGAIGYKLKFLDKVICIITDHEYRSDTNKDLLKDFIKKSDILIMDSYFINEDFISGWGHSTIEECVDLVNELDIGLGIPFHHNTSYNDDFLKNFELKIREKNKNIIFAKDGMTFGF